MEHLIAWLDGQRGRRKALSEALGVKQNNLSQWREVPPKLVLRVEAFTGVSRHLLSPDVFGPAEEAGA